MQGKRIGGCTDRRVEAIKGLDFLTVPCAMENAVRHAGRVGVDSSWWWGRGGFAFGLGTVSHRYSQVRFGNRR